MEGASGKVLKSPTEVGARDTFEGVKLDKAGNTVYRKKILWDKLLAIAFVHLGGMYGFYLAFTCASLKTIIAAVLFGIYSGLGITAGAHRLWAHRTYKAKLPLRMLLASMNSMAYEKDIYHWCRDHRVHHMYTETDADPHNAKRGFFFSHVGWLMIQKHPEVYAKGQKLDLSDLLQDPVIVLQKKFYMPLVAIFWFVLPMAIPTLLWKEDPITTFFVAVMARYMAVLNASFCVNSVAHMWGNRPYDKYISPVENALVSIYAIGEGFHNYHHTFPWDYATSEFGTRLNLTTRFIDLMAWLGLAYDLRTASPEMIEKRKRRTGEYNKQDKESEETMHLRAL